MMNLVRTSGVVIPRVLEVFNRESYDDIKRELTRTSKDYLGHSTITLQFFIEGFNYLKVPRFFPIQKYINDFDVEDKIPIGEDISINHNIELRDESQKDMVEYLLKNDNGIIQAQPGSGKTVVSIYMIAERKKKTIILVHRDSLADQWKSRFLQYTDVKESDIVRLKSNSYVDDLKKPIIIVTDQTFTSILKRDRTTFLEELYKANIGIFLADEVHTSVGAPTFAECSIHIPSRFVYGLSATPYRYDGNSDVIKYHLGEIYVPKGRSTTMAAKVTVLLFSYGIMSSKTRSYINWGGQFNKARYLTQLIKSKSLMGISKALLDKLVKDGKEVIFVSERIKMIEELYDSLLYSNKSKFIQSAKNDMLDYQITFATPGKIRDGVDCPQKNCLVLTSPIGNIDQMGGRISRIKEGKEQPIVIDMVDIDEPEIYNSLFHRIKFYKDTDLSKKEEWEIQYILIDKNGNKRFLDENEVRKFLKKSTGGDYDS